MLSLAFGLGAAPLAQAALGKLNVLSARGEPLLAEAELSGEGVLDHLLVGLADPADYGAAYPFSAQAGKLSFSLHEQEPGRYKVRIYGPAVDSAEPLRFAVQVSWEQGRVIREYEIGGQGLLAAGEPSPQDYTGTRAAPAPMTGQSQLALGPVVDVSRQGEPLRAELLVDGELLRHDGGEGLEFALPGLEQTSAETRRVLDGARFSVEARGARRVIVVTSPARVYASQLAFTLGVEQNGVTAERPYLLRLPARHGTPQPEHRPPRYQVAQGDTLTGVARRFYGTEREAGMQALLHANPHAFAHGNPDHLYAGAELSLPALHVPGQARPASKAHVAPIVPEPPAPKAEAAPPKAAEPPPARHTPPPAAHGKAETPAPPAAAAGHEAAPAHKEVPSAALKAEPPVPPAASQGAQQAEAPAVKAEQKLQQLEQQSQQKLQQLLRLQERIQLLERELKRLSSQPQPVPPPMTPKESRLLDMELARWLAGGIGGLTVLSLLAWQMYRRRRAGVQPEEGGGTVGDVAPPVVRAPHAGDSTVPAPLLSAEEPDDDTLLAEVEALIAYGKTDDARTLLLQLMERRPQREDVRFRLLQLYALQNNKVAFEAEAQRVLDNFGASSGLWERTAALGRTLDPDNALYQEIERPLGQPFFVDEGGAPAAAVPPPPAAPSTSSEMEDFDLDEQALELPATPSPIPDEALPIPDLEEVEPPPAPSAMTLPPEELLAPQSIGLDDIDTSAHAPHAPLLTPELEGELDPLALQAIGALPLEAEVPNTPSVVEAREELPQHVEGAFSLGNPHHDLEPPPHAGDELAQAEEVARLFREMGDNESADAVLREAHERVAAG